MINNVFGTGRMVEAAPDRDDETKIKLIGEHFGKIMEILGLDMTDDSLKDTPARVGRMYVKELFSGLDPKNKPDISFFENRYGYSKMLVEKNVSIYSICEYHFVPIVGKAHIGYISSGRVIGASKLNRIVQYCARRPQVQERLTVQIAKMLKEILATEDVAVVIDAFHYCGAPRGVEDAGSTTLTTEYSGRFLSSAVREEFLHFAGL